MPETHTIELEKSQGVARITFNRPKHNVFNSDMMREFNGVLESLGGDDGLKCIVILGEGRSWCAGVDVGDHEPQKADEMIALFNRSFELIHAFEVPLIAAVHGACLGGGMEYAIACDMVVASEGASFGQPEIKLGFFPPYAAVRLPQLIGPARAIEVCTRGKIYSAKEGAAMGFVSQLTGAEDFSDTVESLIEDFRSASPLIIRLNKRAVNAHLGMPLNQAMAGVSDLFLNTLMKTEDTLEGIASFYEKRKPQWKNR